MSFQVKSKSVALGRSVQSEKILALIALIFASCGIQFGLGQGDACQAGDPATCNGNILETCDPDLLVTLHQECPAGTTCEEGECLPAIVPPRCGDGISGNTAGEECDDGDTNNSDTTPDACRTDCTLPFCGDNIVDPNFDEDCDPPTVGTCSADCKEISPGCGNGIVEAGEECDDGNNNSDISPDACRTSCRAATCGDSTQDTGEECDDGNNTDGDFCEADCSLPRCGNGIVDPLIGEECDDNNNIDNDGCDANCSHADVVALGAGINFSCAVLDTGALRCWGQADGGQLGYGNNTIIGDNEHPFTAGNVNVGGPVKQIVGGGFFACALLQNGKIRCWGGNSEGQLGYGNTTTNVNNIPNVLGDVPIGGDAIQIASGDNHSCALMTNGGVRCWGRGFSGRLGYVNEETLGDEPGELPQPDIQLGGPAIQIALGTNHSCAVMATGGVRCWGFEGGTGKLGHPGIGNIGDNETPASVGDIELGGTATQVTVGNLHTCALLNTKRVRCWGTNTSGQLGYENTSTIGLSETPATAYAQLPNNGDLDLGGDVIQVEASDFHTCAVLDTGKVRCWGSNAVDSNNDGTFDFVGALGSGTLTNIGDQPGEMPPPDVNLGGVFVTKIAVGQFHNCALLDTGKIRCWGRGANGRLGYLNNSNVGDNETPAQFYSNLPTGDVQVAGPALP